MDENIIILDEVTEETKLTEVQRKLAKHIIKRIIVGTVIAVGVHFAAQVITNALEKNDDSTEEETENDD